MHKRLGAGLLGTTHCRLSLGLGPGLTVEFIDALTATDDVNALDHNLFSLNLTSSPPDGISTTIFPNYGKHAVA